MDREFILSEIRRTADKKSGKALGSQAFQNATGIGPYDWGKYWARYNDAVEDAGFERNEPYTRYADKYLVEKLIWLIRKLGKYPTLNEMRIESIQTNNFPYNAIRKRQRIFVKKVVEYCEQKAEFEDILAICKPIAEGIIEEECSIGKVATRVGEVYLYQEGIKYKIGKTFDIDRRSDEIRRQSPNDRKLIHTIKTDDPSGVERYWLLRFKDKNIKSEWFKLSAQDVAAFKRWKRIT